MLISAIMEKLFLFEYLIIGNLQFDKENHDI